MTDRKIIIDFDGEIIPGHGAAGLVLGTNRIEIDKRLLDSDDITLHFEEDMLTQIGVTGDYKGKLISNLGLGDLVSDFEKVYGPMIEGDEDELTFKNIKGFWFDVDDSKYNSYNWWTEIPKLPVTHIYVFKTRW